MMIRRKLLIFICIQRSGENKAKESSEANKSDSARIKKSNAIIEPVKTASRGRALSQEKAPSDDVAKLPSDIVSSEVTVKSKRASSAKVDASAKTEAPTPPVSVGRVPGRKSTGVELDGLAPSDPKGSDTTANLDVPIRRSTRRSNK